MKPLPRVAGIELGGTKSIAILARGRDMIAQTRVPTTTPAETLAKLIAKLDIWAGTEPSAAIGIASFGPLSSDPVTRRFTGIANTPKAGWSNTPLVAPIAGRFAVPVELNTDVAGAALAEYHWGAFAGSPSLVYLTIGTGIGGAIIIDGKPVAGLSHSELGHFRVRQNPANSFAGICPFHGDCLEGLASGPAIAARAGKPASELGPDHPVWTAVADALAELAASLILTTAPHHILFGGGVGNSSAFPLQEIRSRTVQKLCGYVAGFDGGSIDLRIAQASLGDLAGPLGAVALATKAIDDKERLVRAACS